MSVAQLEKLLQEQIVLKDGCGFCEFGQKSIGDTDDRGSVIIHQTGVNPVEDWYAVLQDTVTSDPRTGFRILLLPTGHVRAFAQVAMNYNRAVDYGLSIATVSIAMQEVRAEDAEHLGVEYVPMERIDGKCFARANSQEHMHIKFDEPSGGLAQPFPVDTKFWIRNQEPPVNRRGGMIN
ncbi:hypothetical protein COV17_03490 [Candidatus Woesearchaeota archaeon CG10_big_fil_rev_8_21_14_0_10_36_11]|nr:MAG: hypothetical protein COV17_03490 [Candidatus Woesearchaeota archaeon CG10_big_fil_rev_8_21_14_0_10_36_11]